MKSLLAILTAAVFALSAAFPAVAESNEMIAAPATTTAPSGHKVKKVKKARKVKKIKKHKARKGHKAVLIINHKV